MQDGIQYVSLLKVIIENGRMHGDLLHRFAMGQFINRIQETQVIILHEIVEHTCLFQQSLVQELSDAVLC